MTGMRRAPRFTRLKISNPGATDQQEVLSSAWVNIGAVTAGSRSATVRRAMPRPGCACRPCRSRRAAVYEEKTKVHQEVMGEIEALKRALTRNQRVLAGLDQRIASATGPTWSMA